jgi:Pyruvate/2-oxoacid:ferredoxin oxidoreductase delta subunit
MGQKVIFCSCGSERIKQERLELIEKMLVDANVDLIIISDLCGVSVLEKEKLANIFRTDNEYLIVGCYSRTMKLLLEKSGIEPGNYSCKYINFFESDDEAINRETALFSIGSDINRKPEIEDITSDTDWPSWFPVIDYSRCTVCGQCADFCLFGVYGKTDEKINVINAQECKNNCPACARICPQTAIIFPKYKQGGAIGGSDIIDEIAEQRRQAEDIDSILNGDIYSALKQRKEKRRSIVREEAMNKAIEERLAALNNTNTESK